MANKQAPDEGRPSDAPEGADPDAAFDSRYLADHVASLDGNDGDNKPRRKKES